MPNSSRCALINISTGIVENVIVADASIHTAPDGYMLLNHDAPNIGDKWDGEKLILDKYTRFPKYIDAPAADSRLRIL
jgi:hypothetical protein